MNLRLAFEVDRHRRHRQAGNFGAVANGFIALKTELQFAFLWADLNCGGIAGDTSLIIFRIKGQRHGLLGLRGNAVDRPAVDFPTALVKINAETASGVRGLAAQESAPGIEILGRFELRVLVVGAGAHCGPAAHEQIGIGDVAAGFIQHFHQGTGKHSAIIRRLLRQLCPFTRG